MKYYIDGKKYRVKPEEAYIRVNGWCFDEEGLDYELKAMVDVKETPKGYFVTVEFDE